MTRPADPGRFQIIVPARYPKYTVVLLAIWIAVCAAASAFVLALLFSPPGSDWRTYSPPAAAIGGFLLLLSTAGLLLAAHFVWVLRGREVIELSDGLLRFRRQALWKGRWAEVPVGAIRALRADRFREKPIYPSWGRRFVGKGDAYIAFDTDGREYHLCRGLSGSEAEHIVNSLRRQIEPA